MQGKEPKVTEIILRETNLNVFLFISRLTIKLCYQESVVLVKAQKDQNTNESRNTPASVLK